MENTVVVRAGGGPFRCTLPAEIVPIFPQFTSTSGERLSAAAAQGGGPPCRALPVGIVTWPDAFGRSRAEAQGLEPWSPKRPPQKPKPMKGSA